MTRLFPFFPTHTDLLRLVGGLNNIERKAVRSTPKPSTKTSYEQILPTSKHMHLRDTNGGHVHERRG